MTFADALAVLCSTQAPTETALATLLACSDTDAPNLYAEADRVRAARVGNVVHLRGLLEFSNICRCNCAYCGLRRDNDQTVRYRLTPENIVAIACEAEQLGFLTLVMQSGEDAYFSGPCLAEIISAIKAKTCLAITLSVGERDEADYRLWREAGADRYLMRIESTDAALYRALHADGDLEKRKTCLRTLKRLGYQLGSGVMIGLPGQTWTMLARDILWLRELGAEMLGIGPFIPHPETPLAAEAGGTLEQALRLVAVLRLVFPYAHIPATTAMISLDPLGREKALQAGANVVMPAVTPTEIRPLYALYPGKVCLDDNAHKCRGCIEGRIGSIGRTVATGPGHVLRPDVG